MTQSNTRTWLGAILIVAAAALWASDAVLRQSLYSLPPLTLVFWEHLLGAMILIPYIIKHRSAFNTMTQQTWGSLVWVGLFGGLIGTGLYTAALANVHYIPLSVVVLLQQLQPIFAILLAVIVLKERLSKRFLALAVLALAGAYFMTFPDYAPTFDTGDKTFIAALMALGAAFAWGSSTVFGKKALKDLKPSFTAGMRMLITTTLAVPAMVVFGQTMHPTEIAGGQWWRLVLIVLFSGTGALLLYYNGLKRTPAKYATLLELAWPLTAILIDVFALKTTLAPTQWIGASVLLLAMVGISFLSRRLKLG